MEFYMSLKNIDYEDFEEMFDEYCKDNNYNELYILKIAIESYIYKIEKEKNKGE